MENAYAVSRFLLSGSGGQGVITMAILLAEAAVKYEGLVAVQSQSYGPEARGGATRSDVILSHKAIYYPKVEQPNILVALTDAAPAGCASMIPSSCIRAARWRRSSRACRSGARSGNASVRRFRTTWSCSERS